MPDTHPPPVHKALVFHTSNMPSHVWGGLFRHGKGWIAAMTHLLFRTLSSGNLQTKHIGLFFFCQLESQNGSTCECSMCFPDLCYMHYFYLSQLNLIKIISKHSVIRWLTHTDWFIDTDGYFRPTQVPQASPIRLNIFPLNSRLMITNCFWKALWFERGLLCGMRVCCSENTSPKLPWVRGTSCMVVWILAIINKLRLQLWNH